MYNISGASDEQIKNDVIITHSLKKVLNLCVYNIALFFFFLLSKKKNNVALFKNKK